MTKEETRSKLLERRILLLEEINAEVVVELQVYILGLNIASPDPITLLIDSEGGDVQPALWLVDSIRCSKAPVVGIVHGRCASSATTVLQACHKRMMTRHSYLYVHPCGSRLQYRWGQPKGEVDQFLQHQHDERELEWYQDAAEQIMSSRTGKPIAEIRSLMEESEKYNVRIRADRAKELGLIDEVVEKYDLFG